MARTSTRAPPTSPRPPQERLALLDLRSSGRREICVKQFLILAASLWLFSLVQLLLLCSIFMPGFRAHAFGSPGSGVGAWLLEHLATQRSPSTECAESRISALPTLTLVQVGHPVPNAGGARLRPVDQKGRSRCTTTHTIPAVSPKTLPAGADACPSIFEQPHAIHVKHLATVEPYRRTQALIPHALKPDPRSRKPNDQKPAKPSPLL